MPYFSKQSSFLSFNSISLVLLSLVVLLALSACDPNRLYETNTPVAAEKWSYDDVKTFSVDVKDTTTRYNIYINVRHSFLFEWRNIYVQVATRLPDGKQLEKRVNLPLCESDGKWYGSCLGDNCDLKVLIQENAKFPMIGRYTFSIRQDMRVNPLERIKSIGMRVEKAAPPKAQQ
jgi:gliding motility-associated lipoprotein GldH